MASTLSIIYREPIAAVLMRLWDARIPEANNFCAFSWKRGYVQCLAGYDETEMWCEAVSAQSWPDSWTGVAADAPEILAELGFHPPDSFSPNHYQLIEIASRDAFWRITDTLIAAMERVFSYSGESALLFKCSIPGLVS